MQNNILFKKKKVLILGIIFSCFLFLLNCHLANAATLYFSPPSGNFSVGNIISLNVLVNTNGVAVNNAETNITFPTDLLSVVSLSKADSIFSLWVEGPSFSNNTGVINLNGGLPTPGFNGTAGKILNIVFTVKKEGAATVLFSSGAVRANDGLGTDVLSSKISAQFVLSPAPSSPPQQTVPAEEGQQVPTRIQPPPTPGQPPAAPIAYSYTHPDVNRWYSNNAPAFDWELPSDVSDVSLLLNKKLNADPGSISSNLIDSKQYEVLEDGVWYFHIKFKNDYGWGDFLNRKVLIDTLPPDTFEVTIDNGNDPTNPVPIILFQSQDSGSGVYYYEIKTEYEISSTTKASTKDNPYKFLPLPPGQHTVEVKAVDRARNFTLSSANFKINCIPEVPKITDIPISVNLGEPLVVKGNAAAGRTVRIYIQKNNEKPFFEKVIADKEGKFSLDSDKIFPKGDYVVWALIEDERGALGCPAKEHSLEVGLPPFLKIGQIVISYLTTIITLIVLIIAIIAAIYYFWYRISLWRKMAKKETREALRAVLLAFKTLRKEIKEQIASFDGKPGLNVKEKKIRDKLNDALDASEKAIKKEIKDIERELKDFSKDLF